ncbi:MAG: hypothetical protein ACUVQK_06230 [Thermogutta sp.]
MPSRSVLPEDDCLPPAVLLYERRGLWHLALRTRWEERFAPRGDSPSPAWIRFGRLSEMRTLASRRPGSFFVVEVRSGWEPKVAQEIAHLRRWQPHTKTAVVSQRAKVLEAFFRELGAAAVADRVGYAGLLAAMIYSHFRSLPEELLNPWALAWDGIPWREFASGTPTADISTPLNNQRRETTALRGESTE